MAVTNVASAVNVATGLGQGIAGAAATISAARLASKAFEKLEEKRESLFFKGEWKDGASKDDPKVFVKTKEKGEDVRGIFGSVTDYAAPRGSSALTSAAVLTVAFAALQGIRFATGQSTVIDWGKSAVSLVSGKAGR